jgi:hypothetical protein
MLGCPPVSLLREIENAAAGSTVATTDLLRKCLILSYRLDNGSFRAWVERELEGYPVDADLPGYRRDHRGGLRAQVANAARWMNGVAVPLSLLPDWYRDDASRFDFRESVSFLESLVADTRAQGHATLHRSIAPEVFGGIEIYEGYSTLSMDVRLPVSVVTGIIDQVRSRALRFALEIEAQVPEALDDASVPSVAAERLVTQIFYNTILGSVAAVAQGSRHVEQVVDIAVARGDLESLLLHLRTIGVEEADLEALPTSLQMDAGAPSEQPGPRTREWIGRVTFKLAASASRIGEGAAGGAIALAIARYLGLAG